MKIWITKYALTDGISEGEIIAEHKTPEYGVVESKIRYLCRGSDGDQFYLTSDDFRDSLDSAIQKAEEMRQERIDILKKQIKNLEEMRFE